MAGPWASPKCGERQWMPEASSAWEDFALLDAPYPDGHQDGLLPDFEPECSEALHCPLDGQLGPLRAGQARTDLVYQGGERCVRAARLLSTRDECRCSRGGGLLCRGRMQKECDGQGATVHGRNASFKEGRRSLPRAGAAPLGACSLGRGRTPSNSSEWLTRAVTVADAQLAPPSHRNDSPASSIPS